MCVLTVLPRSWCAVYVADASTDNGGVRRRVVVNVSSNAQGISIGKGDILAVEGRVINKDKCPFIAAHMDDVEVRAFLASSRRRRRHCVRFAALGAHCHRLRVRCLCTCVLAGR